MCVYTGYVVTEHGGTYEYGTILQLIKLYSDGQVQNNLQYKRKNIIHVIIIYLQLQFDNVVLLILI